MTQLELDMEATPILCANCGAEVTDDDNPMVTNDECQECYVNEDCPAECNDQHRAPDVTRDGNEWECPTTGEEFYYTGQADGRRYGEWHAMGRYGDSSVLVDGWYYNYDETFYCEHCDVQRHQDDYDEEGYCTNCTDARGCYSIDGVSLAFARCETGGCRNALTHFNPLTETAHCAEHAGEHDESLESLANEEAMAA